MSRIHALTGDPLDKPKNGKPRPEIAALFKQPFSQGRANRSKLSYDAARSGTDLDNHWAFADGHDSDTSNSRGVRHTLMRRSRYEDGSNGNYAGMIRTHANMLIGKGPSLRMLTQSRDFNQMVERRFGEWSAKIGLRRKLWCMAHARTMDGEVFAVFTNNENINDEVQLDIKLIEAEQCQTPYLPVPMDGYIDGIRFDEKGNILWYDILPQHPGSGLLFSVLNPVPISPSQVIHWWKMERPSAHRSSPELKASLNCGASARRWREANLAAAETAADIAAMLTTQASPASDSEPDPVAPFSSVEFAKRMLMISPMGWDVKQMKGEHPNAQFAEFNRALISESARPLSMPFNLAACDSSTYSFASGKLDTLAYFAAIDVEREDCNDLVLDRIFAEWFREFTIIEALRDQPPSHQWDWPAKPIIDEESHSRATDIDLKNGRKSFRQVMSEDGGDFEDHIAVMAEDTFGEATDETLDKTRKMLRLMNTETNALPYVAEILGVTLPQPVGTPDNATPNP